MRPLYSKTHIHTNQQQKKRKRICTNWQKQVTWDKTCGEEHSNRWVGHVSTWPLPSGETPAAFPWRTNFLPKALEKHGIYGQSEGNCWPQPAAFTHRSRWHRGPRLCRSTACPWFGGWPSLDCHRWVWGWHWRSAFPSTGWQAGGGEKPERQRAEPGLTCPSRQWGKMAERPQADSAPAGVPQTTGASAHTVTAPAQTLSIVGGGRRTLIFSSLPTSIDAMIWQVLARSKKVSLRVRR